MNEPLGGERVVVVAPDVPGQYLHDMRGGGFGRGFDILERKDHPASFVGMVSPARLRNRAAGVFVRFSHSVSTSFFLAPPVYIILIWQVHKAKTGRVRRRLI
jgi:hypothetical protein